MSTSISPIANIQPMALVASVQKAAEPVVPAAVDAARQLLAPAGSQATMPLAAFDPTAGMHHRALHHVRHDLPLEKRLQRGSTRTDKTRRRAAAGHSDFPDHDIEEASGWLLSVLARDGDTRIASELEERYDPLERYTLFQKTARSLARKNMPEEERQRLQDRLKGMSRELTSKHGGEIKRGLAAAGEMEAAVRYMEALRAPDRMHPGSTDDLRALYGSKGTQTQPFGAVEMATRLREKFGDDSFADAFSKLRRKMLGELRSMARRSSGARLWVSLKDAEAFRSVQEAYSASGDLRRGLAEIGVRPQMNQAAMTTCLLTITDAGKVRAGSMIAEIADFKALDPVSRARALKVVRDAIARLPRSMWPAEKSAQNDIVNELDAQIISAYTAAPTPPTREQRRERSLREGLRSRRN